jgi:hypothetical protein
LQARLRGTYDVIPGTKPVFQGTYTKRSNAGGAYKDDGTSRRRQGSEDQTGSRRINATNEKQSSSNVFLAKGSSGIAMGGSSNPKRQTEFLRILLGGNHMVLKSISPESSLKDYVQAMKSSLEEVLGLEMFTALHEYLCFDVRRDLDSEVDVCEPLFETLGEDGIVFVPLMLQYIQCERNISTE